MAIQLLGADGNTVAAVDSTFKAQRVTLRPPQVLGWNSYGLATGSIATPAAGGALFVFRNTSANIVLVRRLGVGLIVTAAITTAQRLDLQLHFARNYTVTDTTGAGAVTPNFTGNNGKHRTSLATPTALDGRIAGTAILSGGTKTLDANPLGLLAGYGNAIGYIAITPSPENMLSQSAGDYSIVLAQNEGLVLSCATAVATGSVTVFVNFEFAEASDY